ncbi:MAG: NAD-dependent epimerase/dehydratase family protein [Candidatus Heimdallarchaeota archaeon]
MAKIFITGATGQVGGQLAELIIKENLFEIATPKDIVCLVRNPAKANKLKELGITILEGDLQASDAISEAMSNGIEYVFHVAANILLNQTYDQMYKPNVLGTRIMLDAFVKSNAKCFVHTSSIGVYEAFNGGRKREYHLNELSKIGSKEGEPYAVTKRIAEDLVNDYTQKYPDKIFVTTRLGPIVGPGDRQTLPALIDAMSYKMIPKLINRGKHLFAITSPVDVAKAQIFLANFGHSISGEIYNVSNGAITFRELMDLIADYYYRRHPKFSITYGVFKFIRPLLRVLGKIFPNFKLIKIALSPVTTNYIGRTYIYSSKKLCDLGFAYTITPEKAVVSGLEWLDPKHELIKPNKRLKTRRTKKKSTNK